jgi:aquaporin Z
MNARALAAEAIGTFALVFVGCGTAMLLGPASPITILTTALAFGLTALSSAFALGHISGGHFNPAVTIGLIAGGRFQVPEAFPYIVAQCLGAAVAAALLVITLSGAPVGPNLPKLNDMGAIASHFGGKGEFSILAAFVAETISAALLVTVIMGSTAKRASAGFAPIVQSGAGDGDRDVRRRQGYCRPLAVLGRARYRRSHRWCIFALDPGGVRRDE